MFKEDDFEDIRPYYDVEINPALRRITANPVFDKILDFLFPGQDKNRIKDKLIATHSAIDFQLIFMHPLVNSILNQTSKGLTFDGFEQLKPGTPYLFVSNHRDIVLDSAMLQMLLFDNKHSTSEITFGSNLMTNPFIIDLGKVNRMFKVYRGGNKMELFKNSKILSAYIRYTLTHKKVSIWIAQRNGRTKDGNDKTESGVFKMFNISGHSSFYESFKELNIVPLSVSYEYEPCCSFKIKEQYASLHGTYQKKPDEDLQSILTGITQSKGRIHMSIGKPVNEYLKELDPVDPKNKINSLVELFDAQIYRHYRLWPNNYIAYDRLFSCQDNKTFYTPSDKKVFLEYMENEIKGLVGERKKIEELFLKIYANPLINLNRIDSDLLL
jgi:hypothetical protein